MTDREMLELAAKASDKYQGEWSDKVGALRIREGHRWIEWNPLTDDGDALRLAVKLKLTVKCGDVWVGEYGPRFVEDIADDPHAATRRAIVRAAAFIGEEMK